MAARENLLLPGCERWPKDRPVIEIQHAAKSFGEKQVLRDINLTVETGKTTVIAGESGCGKTVLLRLMNGLTLPDAGHVFLFGRDLQAISERERTALRKRCTMVFQNYALMDSLSVAENVAFPLKENTSISAREIRKLVENVLELFELRHAIDEYPSSLSGGMKKRVALARAVVSNPEVVLFDEPTTGLDPVMIEFVDQLIRKTQAEFDLTSVVISHDMASNSRLADKMAFLADGRIVAQGSYQEACSSNAPEIQGFLKNSSADRLKRSAQAEASESPVKPAAQPVAAQPVKPAVRVEGLYKSFGDHMVLKGIDLEIPEKKITVVIGGSGSGKSVLIKHISGLFKPDSGHVYVLGECIDSLDGRELQKLQGRIGMLFQGAALFDSMNIYDNIAYPLIEGHHRKAKEVKKEVLELAEKVKIADLLKAYPGEISNGQRKRVGLARALITRPEIIIYDEPTTGQDPIMMQRVDSMITETQANFPITSIVISHDMASTFRIADKIAMIYHGDLVLAGTPSDFRNSPDERVQRFIYAGSGDSAS